MSFEVMRSRLNYLGGANQQDRMIKDKLRSMLSAIKSSYQSAKFSLYADDHQNIFKGLFNRSELNEEFDTKTVSAPLDASLKAGDIICWENTSTLWIIFLQHMTELAYFRGDCRRCDHILQWVDAERKVQKTPASIIGPTHPSIRNSSSMGAQLVQDFPTANLKLLIPDTPLNNNFFKQYQTFLLKGRSYRLEQINDVSMPGILQLTATEYYANLVEDDVEENLRNAWNVLPIINEHEEDFVITGKRLVKPKEVIEFSSSLPNGTWLIIENNDNKTPFPAKILNRDNTANPINIAWDSMKSGNFTVGYKVGDKLYQYHVIVESLM